MTTPEFASNRDNFCYRHPDRQSFVLCQRCTRTVCPECQTPAPVGVICPECMKAERKNRTPAQKRAARRWGGRASTMTAVRSGTPVVTYTIIAITALISLVQLIPGAGIVGAKLQFAPVYLYPALSGFPFEPWRLVTALFVHGGLWHLALNMLALWMIGRTLEPMLGRWRFAVLYLLGGIGGNVALALIAPSSAAVGASGAIFAMFGVLLVIGLMRGANMTGLWVLLGINLVIGFIPGFHIAWEAHIGGALTGALVGFVILRTRRPDQKKWQILGLIGVALLLAVLVGVVAPLLVTAGVTG